MGAASPGPGRRAGRQRAGRALQSVRTEYRSLPLLVILVLVLFVMPHFAPPEHGGLGLLGSELLLLAAGVGAAGRSRTRIAVGVLAGLPLLAMTLAGILGEPFPPASDAELWMAVSAIPFSGYIAWCGLTHISRRECPFDDRLIGAACVYLLVGMAWSGFYAAALLRDPGALTGNLLPLEWGRLLYFSYVTLTTLGYGGIRPANASAEMLAAAEAIAGVFFLGFLVARIMAVHTPGSRDRDGRGD